MKDAVIMISFTASHNVRECENLAWILCHSFDAILSTITLIALNLSRVFGGDKGKLRQQGKHGVRGILGLLMNTEQPLYGPHHQYEYGVAKYGLHEVSTCFTKISVFFKRPCIHLCNAVVFCAMTVKGDRSLANNSINVTNRSIFQVFWKHAIALCEKRKEI